MERANLESIARALVAPGKGILAADESTGTIKKRFDDVQVESTEENRRAYRDMLFTTPDIEQFISGVILYDETIHQSARAGMPFPHLLAHRGIIPGIKVDTGAKDMAGFPGEKMTEGLDGLRGRLKEYGGLGAQFAKWRAVITIGDGPPSRTCIEANAEALARYAALCQEAGLVPIVEPEVLMEGPHYHGALRAGDRRNADGGVQPPAQPPGLAGRHAAEAEHGPPRDRIGGHGHPRRRSPKRPSGRCCGRSRPRSRGSFFSPAGRARKRRPGI